jgi:hypothetical protein
MWSFIIKLAVLSGVYALGPYYIVSIIGTKALFAGLALTFVI